MSDDEWDINDDPPPPSQSASSRHRQAQTDEYRSERSDDLARRIAKREIVASWREVGVDFASYEKRQEHAALLAWCRERKRLRETSAAKAWTTLMGALISALVAGVAAYLFGGGLHH